MRPSHTRNHQSGNTLLTAVLFLFVLAGTLRLCFTKTLLENKLTTIFIQETQAFYLMENMMGMTRDYIYQLTQCPYTPNIFFGVDTFKRKGKGNLFEFNDTFVKKQIVPNGFPLDVVDRGWDIKGGPIFWQDQGNGTYTSEVFMLGSMRINSLSIPNWTVYMVQTIDIQRRPLTHFSLYAEGDLALSGNVTRKNSNWDIHFQNSVQINGNARFPMFQGYNQTLVYFKNKLNIAGHALSVTTSSSASVKLPTKYGMLDNYTLYHNKLKVPYRTGNTVWYVTDANNSSKTLSSFNNSNSTTYESSNFTTYKGQFSTRGRIYRPSGFDPIADGGYWTPGESTSSASYAKLLDYIAGFRTLTREMNQVLNASRLATAYSQLRGLNAKQANEKVQLVSSQQPMNFPGIECRILLKNKANVNIAKLDIPCNFPYVTYSATSFPASKDNLYFNRFMSLRTSNETIVDPNVTYYLCKEDTSRSYYITDASTISIPTYNNGFGHHQTMYQNKLVLGRVTRTAFTPNTQFVFTQSEYPLTRYDDTKYPPHKLIDNNGRWEEDMTARTRVVDDARYNYMYDRNRAKWIQIVDIDISKLATVLSGAGNANNTLKINAYWAGSTNNANRNYQMGGKDIRESYDTKRETFMGSYANGSYTYDRNPNPPVVDIGIRLINGSSLSISSLSIICPYPLYIQGNFNTGKKPVFIAADSITILGPNFGDWFSGMDFKNSGFRNQAVGSSPEIYANIMTGRTHPNYWLISRNSELYPDLGMHDAFRTLEDFSVPLKFQGSLMLPYYCLEQWEPPINFCHYTRAPNSYAPVNWNMASATPLSSTQCTPTFLQISRGRKTMMIGKTLYNQLLTTYNKNSTATSYTFKTYHNTDLPTYLKYDKDM